MSKDKSDVSDDATENPGGESDGSSGAEDKSKNSVSFETHEKLLSQRKKDQERLKALEEENKKYKQSALEAEGKKDELIAELRAEKEKKESEAKALQTRFAENVLKSQIALKAKEYGCVDTDMLYKAMDLEKLQVELVDTDLNVDTKSLTKHIEEIKGQKQYLFSVEAPAPRDGNPGAGAGKKLTHEQWLALPYDEQKKRMKDVELT